MRRPHLLPELSTALARPPRLSPTRYATMSAAGKKTRLNRKNRKKRRARVLLHREGALGGGRRGGLASPRGVCQARRDLATSRISWCGGTAEVPTRRNRRLLERQHQVRRATVPAVAEAGTYKVGLANNSIGPHVLIAVRGLPEGITVDQFIEFIDANPEDHRRVLSKLGPSSRSRAGSSEDLRSEHTRSVRLLVPDNDSRWTPHYKLGFVGLFDVAAAP